jgi:predicted CoA-binding protein
MRLSQNEIREILKKYKTVAVVGLSREPGKDSHRVSAYLKRPSKDVPPIVEQAIKLKAMHGKPYVVWMQLGIVNEQAAEAAKKAGLTVVMDKCMMIEHKRFS